MCYRPNLRVNLRNAFARRSVDDAGRYAFRINRIVTMNTQGENLLMLISGTVDVDDEFMAPVEVLLHNYVRAKIDRTEGLTDAAFLRLGVARVLEGDESGRAFIQSRADRVDADLGVARATWFDALHSRRRLKVLEEIASQSYRRFEKELCGRDYLKEFPELNDYPIWAVDGHQIEHACHSPRNAKGEHTSNGVIYGLCLHSGLLRPMARFQGDAVQRHEWPVFKENWRKWHEGEPRKKMPIVVADPAYIDTQYWLIEKIKKQAIIITREKENMKGTSYHNLPFDPRDPVNAGVEADELVGYSNAALRRVKYCDPKTGERFCFITTTHALRPGVVAVLYFLRWKIEKVYDVFKNKLKARKAWAVGETSSLIQSHLMALVHNLLTLFLARLEERGIREEKVHERTAERTAVTPSPVSQQMVQGFSILTCQYIRLVRHCLRYKIPWSDAIPLFRARLSAYI